jgi:hypothetical protein
MLKPLLGEGFTRGLGTLYRFPYALARPPTHDLHFAGHLRMAEPLAIAHDVDKRSSKPSDSRHRVHLFVIAIGGGICLVGLFDPVIALEMGCSLWP